MRPNASLLACGEGAQATFEMQRSAAEAAAENKEIQTKARDKVQEMGAVRARIPPRSGMAYRGYRKRDPQWTDAVLRNVRFEAGGGLVRVDDKDGNSVQLFTSKVLPVPPTSRDTNELRGNEAGIANPAKYE